MHILEWAKSATLLHGVTTLAMKRKVEDTFLDMHGKICLQIVGVCAFDDWYSC